MKLKREVIENTPIIEQPISDKESMRELRAIKSVLQDDIIRLRKQNRNLDVSTAEKELDKVEDDIKKIEDKIINREKTNKEDSVRMIGGGLFDSLLQRRPNTVNSFMKKKGDMKMTTLNICREPIDSKIKKIANKLSRGQIQKTVEKNSYDDVFHLYLMMTFENGEVFSLEKNDIVVISDDHINRTGECKAVDVSQKNLTFNEVMKSAENKHGKNFYRYDSKFFNCQNFLLNFTNEVGVNNFDDFIYQDFSEAISEPLRNASGFATDVKAIFSRLFDDSIKL